MESDETLMQRAEMEIYQKAGIKRKMFESQEEYKDRARAELFQRLSANSREKGFTLCEK